MCKGEERNDDLEVLLFKKGVTLLLCAPMHTPDSCETDTMYNTGLM